MNEPRETENRTAQRRRLAAVVLRRSNYGEADLIVNFLTRELGLVNALARYGRRSRRRFGGGLLSPGVCAWYEFTFKPGRSLAFVEYGEENPRAQRVPPEPLPQALAAFALELVEAFEMPGNPAEASFELLVRHFSRLARVQDAAISRLMNLDFTHKYLELAGFGPSLKACLVCGRALEDSSGPWRWDALAGGLYCPYCGAEERASSSRPVSPAIVARLTGHSPPGQILAEEEITEAELFFELLAAHQLGRPFKGLKAARRYLSGA